MVNHSSSDGSTGSIAQQYLKERNLTFDWSRLWAIITFHQHTSNKRQTTFQLKFPSKQVSTFNFPPP
ncbi:MAG: hypothetical protein ACTS7I_02535, partial [Candidatus Hodgkinia cicadicola]